MMLLLSIGHTQFSTVGKKKTQLSCPELVPADENCGKVVNQASSSAPALAGSALLASDLLAKVSPSFCLVTGYKFHV